MEFTFSNRRWLTKGEAEDASADFALGLHVPGRYDKILNINECHIQSKDSNRILDLVKEMTVDLELLKLWRVITVCLAKVTNSFKVIRLT